MAGRKLVVEIVGDARNFERSLGSATKSTDKFSVSLRKLAGFAAAGVGFAAVTDGIKTVISAAEEAQVSQAKLGVAFKNAGLSAQVYGKQVDGLRDAGRKLGFTNAQTNDSMSRLVTATGSMVKASRDLAVAQDFARFKGVDLGEATKTITSAMGGNIRAIKQLGIAYIPTTAAVDALKRKHMDLTTVQGRALLAAAKLDDKQRNSAAVIDLVSQKVKGQAAAYSSTTAGAMARFRAALDDIEEKIGQKLLPVMTRMVNYVTNHLPDIERVFKQIVDGVQPAVIAIAKLAKKLNDVVQALGGWSPIIEAVAAFWIAKMVLVRAAAIRTATTVETEGAAMAASAGRNAALWQAAWLGAAALVGTELGQIQSQYLPDPELKKRAARTPIPGKGGFTVDPATGKIYGGDKGAQIEVSIKTAAKVIGISVDKLRAEIAKLNATKPGVTPPGIKGPQTGKTPAATVPGAPPGVTGKLPGRTAPSASTQEQQLLGFARMLLGSPYVYGQMSKAGVDCSGLVAWAYAKMGISLPHSTYAQVGMGQFVTGGTGGMTAAQQRRLRPGDVIFTQYGEGGKSGPGHEALYAGGGRVEVARHTGTRVQYQSLSDLIGSGAFSVRRFLGDVKPGEGYDPTVLDTGTTGTSRSSRSSRARRARARAPSPFGGIGAGVAGAAGEVSKAAADAQKAADRMVAELIRRNLKMLGSYGAGGKGGGGVSKAGLGQEMTQIEGQIKTGMVKVDKSTQHELDVVRQILRQPWIPPEVRERIRGILDGIRQTFTDRLAAVRQAAADKVAAIKEATAGVGAAIQDLGSSILSAFDAISAQYESPAAKQLKQMQAEDAAKSAVDAYNQAVQQYGPDSPEVQAAARALTEAQLAAQAAADDEAHAAKVKQDKDALEKRLAALQQEATGAKTRAQAKKIQDEINALLAEYGITPATVQAAGDWNASQALFASGVGSTVGALQTLTDSIDKLVVAMGGGGTVAPSGLPGGQMPHAQSGGFLAGHGGIPIMAHGGEYVINAAATRKLGVGFLNSLNRYQDGGLVRVGDSDYASYLRTRHGKWQNPRYWAADELRTSTVYRDMLEKRFGDQIHFEDAWVQALYKVQGRAPSLVLDPPPHGISDATSGQVWYDFPGGQYEVPKVPELAAGGRLLTDGLFYGHAGEAVTPASAAARGGPVHITLEVDRRVLGTVVMDELGRTERYGGPIKIRR